MKCKIIIDADREEEILVYAKAPSALTRAIENLAQEQFAGLIGYRENVMVPLDPEKVECFTVQDNKTIAYYGKEKWQVKSRLYQLEEWLPESFIKINQSCLANQRKIARFEGSFAGALEVLFECGYREFVSRRQLKFVKERFVLNNEEKICC